jgi:hypothetical protein
LAQVAQAGQDQAALQDQDLKEPMALTAYFQRLPQMVAEEVAMDMEEQVGRVAPAVGEVAAQVLVDLAQQAKVTQVA